MKNTNRKVSLINISVFVTGLTVMGILFFALPKQKVSVYEKRNLTAFPRFCWDSVFFGKYADSLDMYVADNFPYRDEFVEVSFNVKNHSGFHSDRVAYYKKTFDQESEHDADTAKIDSAVAVDTVAAPAEAHENNGLMICNGKAIQMFGGNKKVAEVYAATINKFYEKYKKQVQVYDLVTPTTGEFYLPQEYKKYYASERKNIDFIYGKLSDSIHKVDDYDELSKHTDQYIFFNTDHHWTGLGAYYAYEAFCNSAGMAPVGLELMEKKTIHNFLGSLYWLTRDPELKDDVDSVIYYKVPMKNQCFKCTAKCPEKGAKSSLYVEFASGPNSYGVFLGGDLPLLRVDTDLKNGRKVLFIKNSFGNAFAPYLVSHYEQVYIIDYRYFKGSVKDLIAKNGITDLVFLTPTFSANTQWHINKLSGIL